MLFHKLGYPSTLASLDFLAVLCSQLRFSQGGARNIQIIDRLTVTLSFFFKNPSISLDLRILFFIHIMIRRSKQMRKPRQFAVKHSFIRTLLLILGLSGCVNRNTQITGALTTISQKSSGDQQNGASGRILSSPFTVTLKDTSGNPTVGTPVNWGLVAGGGSLTTSQTITDASGIAQTVLILGGSIGTTNTVSASVFGAQTVFFNATTIPDASPSLNVRSGNNQSSIANSLLPAPLVVYVSDAQGNLLSGVPIEWNTVRGGGSLSHQSSITGADGSASANYTLGTVAGENQVTAFTSQPQTKNNLITFSSQGTASTPSTLAGRLAPASAASGSSNILVTATLTDQYGNPLPNLPVHWTTTSGGVLAETDSVTSPTGISINSLSVTGIVGTTVSVTMSSSSLSTTVVETISESGPANSISLVSGNNQSTQAGTPFSAPFVISVTDQSGNPVPNVPISWYGIIQTDAYSTTTDSLGQGHLNPIITRVTPTGMFTAVISTSASNNVVQFSYTLSPGAPSQIITSQVQSLSPIYTNFWYNAQHGGANTLAGTTIPVSLVFRVADVYGNFVPNVPVSFFANGGILATLSTQSDAFGMVTNTFSVPSSSAPAHYSIFATGNSNTYSATYNVGAYVLSLANTPNCNFLLFPLAPWFTEPTFNNQFGSLLVGNLTTRLAVPPCMSSTVIPGNSDCPSISCSSTANVTTCSSTLSFSPQNTYTVSPTGPFACIRTQ